MFTAPVRLAPKPVFPPENQAGMRLLARIGAAGTNGTEHANGHSLETDAKSSRQIRDANHYYWVKLLPPDHQGDRGAPRLMSASFPTE